MRFPLSFWPATVAAALLSGCATPPAPAVKTALPAAWNALPEAAAATDGAFAMAILQEPGLEPLITEALAHNSDLIAAAERVEVVRAQYRLQRAERLPALAVSGGYQRAGTPDGAGGTVTSESWTAGLAVPAWEIDLWGRVRQLSAAARQRFVAVEHNRRALRLSLIAEVANAYYALASLDEQVEIARRTLASRMQSRVLVEQRNLAGLASGLDRQLADSLVANAEQSVAELERQRVRQENALSVLVGRNPGPVGRGDRIFRAEFDPRVAAGLSAELLTRRPDVQAAEAQLQAAELDVGAARKLFLPAISLTAFAGFVSPQLSGLLDSDRDTWSIEPGLALPLFNGGKLRANLAISQAQQRIAAETYRATVRGALRDVEDALGDYQSYGQQRAALGRAVQAAQRRLSLTLERYSVGASPYLDVLDSFREYFSAALAHAQVTRAHYASVVQVYRALGGGWEAPAWREAAAVPAAADISSRP